MKLTDCAGKLTSICKLDIVEGKNQILFEASTLQLGMYIVKLIAGNQFTLVKVKVH